MAAATIKPSGVANYDLLKLPPGFVLPDVSGPLKFDLRPPGLSVTPTTPPTTQPVGAPPPMTRAESLALFGPSAPSTAPVGDPSWIQTISFPPGSEPKALYPKPVITPPKPGPKTVITSGPSGIYGPAKLTDAKSAAAKDDDATLWIGIGLLIYFLMKKP